MIKNIDYRCLEGDIYKDKRTNYHYLIVRDAFSIIHTINLETGSERSIFYETFYKHYQKVA